MLRGTTGSEAAFAGALALGALGGVLGGLLTKDLYLVLTDDWIAVVQANGLTGRPNQLLTVGRRDAGAIVSLRIGRGRSFSTVALHLPGRDRPARLRVHPAWREDLEAFATDLTGGAPAASLGGGDQAYRRSQRIAGGIIAGVGLCVFLAILGYVSITKQGNATPAPSSTAQPSSASLPPIQQVTP